MLWLREAQPCIDLRKPASHGFRGRWQAAELVHRIRSLSERREEWQLPFMLAKVDIQKAYDSVLWTAIQWVFELTGCPHGCRLGIGVPTSAECFFFGLAMMRSLSSCNHGVECRRGAPEGPVIDACIAEELISRAESRLSVNGMPAGVPVPEPVVEQDDAEAVESAKCQTPVRPSNVVYANFADDTYVLAISDPTACVAREFRRTGQKLNDAKCEMICAGAESPGEEGRVRAWGPADLERYESGNLPSRLHPTDGSEVKNMKQVREMTLLGSCIVLNGKESPEAALRHRFKAAWRSWHILREQLASKASSLKIRIALLDTTVMASLLWGLETVSLGKKRRKKITTLQRVYIMRMLRLCRRPDEDSIDYFRRRERVATAMISKHARGRWGQI